VGTRAVTTPGHFERVVIPCSIYLVIASITALHITVHGDRGFLIWLCRLFAAEEASPELLIPRTIRRFSSILDRTDSLPQSENTFKELQRFQPVLGLIPECNLTP